MGSALAKFTAQTVCATADRYSETQGSGGLGRLQLEGGDVIFVGGVLFARVIAGLVCA